jgi:hypothetical protein
MALPSRHAVLRPALRPVAALLLVLAGVLGAIGPIAGADGATSYRQDLLRPGDFVRQTNLVQCVGASMQMMINMVAATNDRTAATQLRLQNRARAYSELISPRPGRRGASVWGWAAGLNEAGFGPYLVAGFQTIDEALHAAAHAIRYTGRPVGLLMWAGRHAWVMSGYRATADPRSSQVFRVTDVYVEDPLYPATSKTWGRSPAPGARLTVKELGKQFVPRRNRSNQRGLGGPYVIVMPLTPQEAVAGSILAA